MPPGRRETAVHPENHGAKNFRLLKQKFQKSNEGEIWKSDCYMKIGGGDLVMYVTDVITFSCLAEITVNGNYGQISFSNH